MAKSLMQVVEERKVWSKATSDFDSVFTGAVLALGLLILVALVGVVFDIAVVSIQQWYQVIVGYWPF
ncbi:hypothetical protein [Bradyrhizobium lupini]